MISESVEDKVFICNIYAASEVAALGILSERFCTYNHGRVGSIGKNITLGSYYPYHFAQETGRSC